jgi:Na+/proline symporter
VATLVVAVHLAGGIGSFGTAYDHFKLVFLDPGLSFTRTYTLWSGLIGGALLSAASHGTDHLIVQRLLAARGLGDARKALIGSGVLVIFQFALFLLVGTSIWLAGAAPTTMPSDQLYPAFVVHRLPVGLAGLVVAGLLAAAMSTVASSLNSLASSSTQDFYAALTGRRDSEHLLRVGRWMTLVWAVILVGGAMLFPDRRTPVVELALQVASLTYGGLLGTYLLGGFWPRARERDVIIAVLTGLVVMTPVVLGWPFRLLPGLAWPWDVPLGTAITMLVGIVSSLVGAPRESQAAEQPVSGGG